MSANPPVVTIKDQRASKLAAEITELYGYITAAGADFANVSGSDAAHEH